MNAVAEEAERFQETVAQANPEATKVKDCAAFDVLRFVLAFAVLLRHMGILTWIWSGNLAVQVFFALSGWLIGSILLNTKPQELNRFYFNRATRIWIPYFATVAALYLTSLFHDPARSQRWSEFLIYDLTFTHNWFTLLPNFHAAVSQMPLHGTGNQFWSLAVEEQFYLLAPLIITVLPFGRSVYVWAFLAIAALLTKSQYASVSFGVLCAIGAATWPQWRFTFWGRAALIVAAVGSAIGMALPGSSYYYMRPFFSAAVVMLCSVPSGRTYLTRWLGGISFPLYLNSWIGVFAFHFVAKHFGMPFGWGYQSLLALSAIAAAAMTYHFIDRVVMENRTRFFNPRLGWGLAAAAYLLVLGGWIYGRHEITLRRAG